MSKKAIVLAAMAAVTLTGCDANDAPSQEEEQAYVDEQAGSATRQQLADDEKDLAETLKELQSKDPSIKEVYYSYNEKGEKVLHVVREEANGKSSESVWPMLAGVGAGALGGYLLAKAMNQSGGMQQYSQTHRPYSTQQFNDDEERRKNRNYAGSSYNSALLNQNRSAVRAAPNFRQNANARVSQWRASPTSAPPAARSAIQSRASGIMSGSGSSARASSHGGSGFGG